MNVTITDFKEINADTVVVGRAKLVKNDMDDAIYMIDGKKVDSSVFKTLKPDDIQSITVLKGESAAKKYGDLEGKGVVEIILKKK
jgi:hypothetical protein